MDGKFKVFVIAAIVVLAGAICGSTVFIMRAMGNNTTQENAMSDGNSHQPDVLKEIALGESILTNIALEDNKVQHFAKVQISIGVDASNESAYTALEAEIEEKAGSIRSEIIAAVGEQTFTMLSNTTTGKEKLSDEIIVRLNKLLNTEMIKAVYYQEYFVQ